MGDLLEMDKAVLQSSFAKEPFPVRHSLSDHPLLTLDALAELADRLPAGSVEHNSGKVSEVLPGGEAPRIDLPPGQIAREIETNKYWMVLKRIEQDPEYEGLLHDALEDVIGAVAAREGGVVRREGYVFLSSSDSTTPSHFDDEHNWLLQIRGHKEMTVGSFPDERTERNELERYYGGGHRNIDFKPARPRVFEMGPGDGVYVPIHAPHMVHTGKETSISLSITFYTQQSQRIADIWTVNSKLRRLNLSPRPPGERSVADRMKVGAWQGMRKVRRAVRS